MSAAFEILNRCGNGKARRVGDLLFVTAFAVAMLVGSSTVEGKLVSAGSSDAPSNNAAIKHSAGIAEILKMVDAGVSKDVIKAYIENSPVAYRPSADEIIALHERRVSQEIIAALLQHGGELRLKLAQSQPQGPSAVAQPVPPPMPGAYSPAVNYAPPVQPVHTDYSYAESYPAYSYASYPGYTYASPYFYSSFYYPYYGYRSCYPRYGYGYGYSYHGYRSCYPRYGYGSGYAQYRDRSCYPRHGYRSYNSGYAYRGNYAGSGGFRAGVSSPRFGGGFAASRTGGFRGGYSSVRHSGGSASVHHGGGSSGRRR